MAKGYRKMEKIEIGIICYDLQEFTVDFINRLVESIDINKYNITAYPMVDNISKNIELKFDYSKGKALEDFKVFKSGDKNTTHEAMLFNPNWKQACLSVKKSDIILHFGLHATTALIIAFLSKLFRVKQISTNVMLPSKYEQKRSKKVLLLKKILLRTCDAHIAQTPTSIETLKKVFNITKNIYYAPFDCGISYLKKNLDTNHSKIRKQTNEKIEFIFVGNIIELKGIYVLFEAIKIVLDKGIKEFHITMIGPESIDNNEKRISELEEILKNLEINKYFTFTGKVKHEELEKYFLEGNIFLLPSLRDTWPKVVLEAALFNLPSLISDACGNANSLIIDNYNGFICESNNSENLANKIIEAINKRDDLYQMGINAKKSLEEFVSPEKETNAYINALEFVNAK